MISVEWFEKSRDLSQAAAFAQMIKLKNQFSIKISRTMSKEFNQKD
ncbi:hypothetical protein BN938_1781 [Mucinivorans hirudinis]|uniref:Uncharacterized protein n=1 Tax=Mucinivorans hirudinis TaxID=1433126 RepID=A0A060R8L2_9BACT|nr:hypothetical protein BN938_1781 [Mucinivorans hirudinis]